MRPTVRHKTNSLLWKVRPGDVMVKELAGDSRLQVQFQAIPLLGQVVHTRPSVTKQYNLMPVTGSNVLQMER